MSQLTRPIVLAAAAALLMLTIPGHVYAQYPVVVAPVQPVVPAVVGYSAERRGLLGRRVVMRPVVAPVAATPVATPAVVPAVVHSVALPPTTVVAQPVLPPPVVLAKPAVAPAAVPVVSGYSSYYAPPPPITTYRVPITSYMPPAWAY